MDVSAKMEFAIPGDTHEIFISVYISPSTDKQDDARRRRASMVVELSRITSQADKESLANKILNEFRVARSV
jgi:hypothetical protein